MSEPPTDRQPLNAERAWLVDGMNVIGSRPDGWWRDPDSAVRRLLERLSSLAAIGDSVTLVLDGVPRTGLLDGMHDGVEVRYAGRHGPDSADDRIVAMVRDEPDRYLVISSDKRLQSRVAEFGAPVRGASHLLRRLDAIEAGRED